MPTSEIVLFGSRTSSHRVLTPQAKFQSFEALLNVDSYIVEPPQDRKHFLGGRQVSLFPHEAVHMGRSPPWINSQLFCVTTARILPVLQDIYSMVSSITGLVPALHIKRRARWRWLIETSDNAKLVNARVTLYLRLAHRNSTQRRSTKQYVVHRAGDMR